MRNRSKVNHLVVVGHGGADRVGVAGCTSRVIVQVLVWDVERAACDRNRLGRPLAPVDRQHMRILRAHVAVRTCQMHHAVFVHHRRDRQAFNHRIDVVHGNIHSVAARAAVVVRDRCGDRVYVRRRARGIIVQVLMCGGIPDVAAVRVDRGHRTHFAMSPVDHYRMRILRAHVRDRTGDGYRAVLVDHCRVHADAGDYRTDVGHGDICDVTPLPPVIVRDSGRDYVRIG